MVKTLSDSLRGQFMRLPLVTVDLEGKTVVVIGASTGLGLEAARHFAAMKPDRLILGCRSKERGEAAVKSIKESTGSTKSIECWLVDLADFSSISAFGDRFEKEGGGRIDLLLCNAAIAAGTTRTTVNGWEEALQTNYLGTALLVFLLLPALHVAPSPRLTIVSSGAHISISELPRPEHQQTVLRTLSDDQAKGMVASMRRYAMTKLLDVLLVRSLARHLSPTSTLTVDSLDPGFCRSELSREAPFILRPLLSLLEFFFARSPEVGSRTLVHAALATSATTNTGEMVSVHGKYLDSCRVGEESAFVLSDEGDAAAQRIWDETIAVLGDADVRVHDVVQNCLM